MQGSNRESRMRHIIVATAMLICFLVLLSAVRAEDDVLVIPFGLDRYIPAPEDNPLSSAKIELGRGLFNDRRLSLDHSLACSSCHDPQHAYTDTRSTAVGVFGRDGTRRVPALINRGYGSSFFWDGRLTSLEEQVVQPIANPNELGMTLEEAVDRIKADSTYVRDFQQAFRSEPNARNLARALASYVRSILSGNSSYDRFLNGDRSALTIDQQHGLELFRGKANCTGCHVGPNFTDEQFHNTGIAWRGGSFQDDGRFAVTHNESDRGAFKTPTLREVARSAPYMHDGSVATLDEVINYYDRGGNPAPGIDPELHPLHLSETEKSALVEFLHALNGQ